MIAQYASDLALCAHLERLVECPVSLEYGAANEPGYADGIITSDWYTWATVSNVELTGLAAEVVLAILFAHPENWS